MFALIIRGLLKWAAALLIGTIATALTSALQLDVLPAVVVTFVAGCVAGYLSTPGYTPMADMLSLMWLGGGAALGFAVALLALGVSTGYFAGGWAIWVIGAALVGWMVVAVPRTAEEDSFFGRLIRRWRRRS
jgi:hypothetical protein